MTEAGRCRLFHSRPNLQQSMSVASTGRETTKVYDGAILVHHFTSSQLRE
jgi:hypothetical protein